MTDANWLRRWHEKRCASKIPLAKATRADAAAEKASRKTGELIISYQCFDCGQWHIGHADQSQISGPATAGISLPALRAADSASKDDPVTEMQRSYRDLFSTLPCHPHQRAAEKEAGRTTTGRGLRLAFPE